MLLRTNNLLKLSEGFSKPIYAVSMTIFYILSLSMGYR